MLDLSLLHHFVTVARTQNLVAAAEQLHLTPGALSKSLKRLEADLQTQLFDRDGRALKLNLQGVRLQEKAVALLLDSEQLRAEFKGAGHSFTCSIAAPALLHLHWGQQAAELLLRDYPNAQLYFEHRHEQAAISAVLTGECDFALVSKAALTAMTALDARLQARYAGKTEFKLVAGKTHPLATSKHEGRVYVADIMQYDFASLLDAPFTALEHQIASDGWRDDIFPRRIRYRSNDMQMLGSLVTQGRALAYLPDYLIEGWNLSILKVLDCPYSCQQEIALVHRETSHEGWLAKLIGHYPVV